MSPKSGTTWTQRIISILLHGEHLPEPLITLCPWIDARFLPGSLEALAARVVAQPYRRSLKSHLPFDALPYDPTVKYVCVGRDGRDVALSIHNHYSGYTDVVLGWLNSPSDMFKERFERASPDIHVFLEGWLTRGNVNYPWETQGYPGLSNLRHVQSFWDFRDLPNIYLVHYDDLKKDLCGEAERLAEFIDVEPTPDHIRMIEKHCSFEAMKIEADEIIPGVDQIMEGGAKRFFHKGVSGRWRDVFTPKELELYEAAVQRILSPDCARWLESGRSAI